MPDHQRIAFDEAARRALFAEAQALPIGARLTEWLLHRLTPAHVKQLDKPRPSSATL